MELFSLHANWQPRRPFTFSGRYAAKWVNENSNGIKAKNNAHLLSARAIWEIAPRWDVSVTGSTVIGRTLQSKTYAVGLELGFLVMENLWLSGGYNFYGYRDDDFANGEYTNKGTYLRLRYKFDEDLFPASLKKGSASNILTLGETSAGSDGSNVSNQRAVGNPIGRATGPAAGRDESSFKPVIDSGSNNKSDQLPAQGNPSKENVQGEQ